MPDSALNNKKPAILLVEDHDGTRRAMTKLLFLRGYAVCPAATVSQALERLDGQAFLVCDMNLPDGLGLTILRKVRADKPRMKIAICSGTTDPDILSALHEHRPDVIFRKPVQFDQLASWLAAALRESA